MIWYVEDDPGIRDIAVYALKATGYEVQGFEDGIACWEALQKQTPSLIILDVMLPRLNGVDLLTRIKTTPKFSTIPVIMATAKGSEFDKIQSLDLGADDYLVKPFGMMEMIARVKAVLRRCATSVPNQSILHCGALTLDLNQRKVTLYEQRIALTYKEFELLYCFVQRPGMVFSREQLYQKVWNHSTIGDTRTVDMHIRSLRQKLSIFGSYIKTVRNVGYRLEVPNDSEDL